MRLFKCIFFVFTGLLCPSFINSMNYQATINQLNSIEQTLTQLEQQIQVIKSTLSSQKPSSTSTSSSTISSSTTSQHKPTSTSGGKGKIYFVFQQDDQKFIQDILDVGTVRAIVDSNNTLDSTPLTPADVIVFVVRGGPRFQPGEHDVHFIKMRDEYGLNAKAVWLIMRRGQDRMNPEFYQNFCSQHGKKCYLGNIDFQDLPHYHDSNREHITPDVIKRELKQLAGQ